MKILIKKRIIYLIDIIIVLGMIPFMVNLNSDVSEIVGLINNIVFYITGYILLILFISDILKGDFFNKHSKWMIIFFLFITIQSVFASNSKLDSLIKIITLFITYLYSTSLIRRYKLEDIIKIVMICNTIILIITFIFIITNPNLAFDTYKNKFVLKGTFPSKNNFATYMLFSTLILLCVIKLKNSKLVRSFYIINIIISIAFLFMSGSMTSIFTLFAVIFICKINTLLNNKLNIAVIGLIINGVTYMFIKYKYIFENFLTTYLNRDLTLTGRTYIWEAILNNIKYKIIFGYGYGTFWGYNTQIENNIIGDYTNKIGGVIVQGSHNGFIELILQIGLIGTLLFIFIIFLSGKKLKYNNDKFIIRFCSYYYIYILIYFITERSLWNMNYQTLFLFIIIEITLKYNNVFK